MSAFTGPPPDAAALARTWHRMIDDAREIVTLLPPEEAGACVLEVGGSLLRLDPAGLTAALEAGRVRFHRGRIRGALPRLDANGSTD